ncbi:N-acetyl-gamma-glutamyl-phosphate reductase [Aureimonas sp. OT7]|uniref:N-acetyl-gamma-glutamyl-phosphate reductase n=1 Tax=Aureimonas TaxID=414371 RepID=UPI001787406D|nr:MULTISPECIES: N-acetyl-gamma-glutamyl-phosphate reductase [Aureimonas]QOG05794.1 N-acetyl-gamma-glutamyl-phosphate reductase [Aureimonas sp. OT7]
MKPRIFIDGEHGTTGLQIRARLARRDDIELTSIPEAERRNADLREEMLHAADIAILCLPDDASRDVVALLGGNSSTRLIDTSTAFRTAEGWVYGFAELEPEQAGRIREARFVANPGCYPTGAIALLRPLRDAGLLPADYPVSVNAVSGYTGGGKQMIAQMEDPTREDAITAPHFLYGLDLQHKHLPEMRTYGRLPRDPIFAPSVGRFAQGMLVQVPLHLAGVSPETIHAALAEHYEGQDIVTVASLTESAGAKRLDPTELAGTDRMKLHVFASKDASRVNLVALLDNLGKGASGAAVQNMDLMLAA